MGASKRYRSATSTSYDLDPASQTRPPLRYFTRTLAVTCGRNRRGPAPHRGTPERPGGHTGRSRLPLRGLDASEPGCRPCRPLPHGAGARVLPRGAPAVGGAYMAFARRRPALCDAMFTQHAGLPFATPEAPAALREAFGELPRAVGPVAGADGAPDVLTETSWTGPHGLVTLMRSGRLPQEAHERRLALSNARSTSAV
ncbi:TetR-like C-terminal domain-containing protein [Actinacidiphila glaucinigra]|uniref:TetR-like C-terminal domain-containing protein n=1 Tax=Actinacidiphila glaucinigra TaxID=235986 RepID=UPI0038212B3C